MGSTGDVLKIGSTHDGAETEAVRLATETTERSLGHDFSRVPIHADARTAASADAVSALGQHIAFASDEYPPASEGGGGS